MVELKNVNVHYSSGVDALQNINLRINDGEFVFIVGGSGAGKSTLVKLMTREIVPTEGRVFVNGYNLSKTKGNKIAKFRRSIGMVFQDFRLIQELNVYENVAFVLRIADQSTRFIKQRVPNVLNLVGLGNKARSKPRELSGGELQRVAGVIAGENGNIIKLEHNQFVTINRNSAVELVITIEAFGPEHKEQILRVLSEQGYRPIEKKPKAIF